MTTRTAVRDILAQIAQDIRALDTLTIDLDGFLELPKDERAARWRGFDLATKFQLCAKMLTVKYGDWDEELVARAIETYDAKWGSAPTTVESAVMGALERLAEENAQSARTARAQGLKDDARFFQRSANAYARALLLYRAGLRPHPTERGGWLLPSQRPGEAPHLLRMDGDWRCTCPSGDSIHWASALLIGIEAGMDDLERFDDCGATAAAEEPEPTPLGQRIAAARARMMQEAA